LTQKNILILDYSLERIFAPAIERWLPANEHITSLFIHTEDSFPDDLTKKTYTHVFHSGSSRSINEPAPFTEKVAAFIQQARVNGIAQMGICYGHQLLCRALVGKHAVRAAPNGIEVGWRNVLFKEVGANLFGVNRTETVWQHHFDEVTELPPGSELLATNAHTEIQAYVNYEQRLFGTQFHPEFDRESGNEFYLKDRNLLEKNNYSVEEIIKGKPSIDAGKIFFGFFLERV